MKIENLRSGKRNNRERISATVIWEDCDRVPIEVFFETEEHFAEDISCDPHAFLVACLLPAMRYGEKRVSIDAEICPELHDGLITVMSWMRHWYDWYGPDYELVKIEARRKRRATLCAGNPRAGILFSGGIDSLATLRANRLNYPEKHPGFIRDGILVYGLEVDEPADFEHVLDSLSVLAEKIGVTLIPVYTNIRSLGPQDDTAFWRTFWIPEYMAAPFAAIGHALSRRLTSLSINSGFDISGIMPGGRHEPHGSHPLIDPNYSSINLRIRHEGITLSRLEKTKLVAGWDIALQHLRVCNRSQHYIHEMLNCGKCEKCIRTMLALEALGALEKTTAFPVRVITPEMVEATRPLAPNTFQNYEELLQPLAERGRHDLCLAIRRKLDYYHDPEWKKTLKQKTIRSISRFDKKYLNGNLRKLKRLVYS